MALTCAVKKCSNGAYWLNKWKKQLCETCGCLHKNKDCKCEPPFRLFAFPTQKKNPEGRERWKQLVGRQAGKKLWSPSKDARVCSEHFLDKQPTMQNPLPTLKLGYDDATKRVKRICHFENPSAKKCKPYIHVIHEDADPVDDKVPESESACAPDPEIETSTSNSYVAWPITILAVLIALCASLIDYKHKVATLNAEILGLKMEIKRLKGTVYTEKILKTDDDVNFYTGLATKTIFNKLHSFVSPFVNRRWTGVTSMMKNIRRFKCVPSRFGPERKMTSKSEFLMTLMKLRLGLLSKDLAKRFDISESLCSRIFLAWLRACCVVLKPLVYFPDEETLIASKPERFRKLPDLHSIIDCTEVFIETPKDLHLQSATWSDYKHHNTVKLLVACAPNSSIVYISPSYTGRISDKALTMDCGYLDMVPPSSMIMADKGFNIANECNDRCLSLYVPPGKRGHSQMTSACVQKTKTIANHRILIEQVIRRIKTYRILANEIPLSLVGHIDEITSVCSGLSNLRQPIYKI